MYLFDTNVFYSFHILYPDNFPSFWESLNKLVAQGKLISVKEVYNEVLHRCPAEHIEEWVNKHKAIFKKPDEKELAIVAELLKIQENRDLVKKDNILRGNPVADPFIIAVAKNRKATVVTMEKLKLGAKIPNICSKHGINCISLKEFFNEENIKT